MKVMFLFQGLPHYYNYVLNKLNRTGGLEVINVVPNDLSPGIGAGVYQTREDVEFKIYELEEYRPIYRGFFFKSFWRVLIKERPDVIVTTEAHLRGFIYNLPTFLMLKFMNIRLILKTHPFLVPKYKDLRKIFKDELIKAKSPAFLRNLRYWCKVACMPIKRFYYKFPDAYVCYSKEAFEIFGSYGVNSDKIFITYNSPDTDRLLDIHNSLSQENINVKLHQLIHVGRLVEWKKVDLLLSAVAKLRKKYPDVKLIVVGDGPKMPEWKELSNLLRIQSQVQFVEGIYDSVQLGKYLISSSIYVLAGMGGLSINEAMCFGLPVICSICDGTERYLVREGINGLFFKEGDTDDLYKKIEYLFTNPELRIKMGANSMDIIRNEINIHTVIDGYAKAFGRVTEK